MEVKTATVQAKSRQKKSFPSLVSKREAGCLHEFFEAQVDLRPDAPALICGQQRLSYAELEKRANRLARFLVLHGAGPGKFVGIYFERSAHPIVAILACLKAGSAYVPLDPSYPGERIRTILRESEAILLLTNSVLEEKSQRYGNELGIPVFSLDANEDKISQHSSFRFARYENPVEPSDLCYVIYTSGTTGKPKGIMAEHRHVFQFVRAFNEVCATSPVDRVFQGFSLTFDGSVEEIWMAFSNGSVLVVPDPDTPRFGNELGNYFSRMGVTYFSTVPTLLATLTEEASTLKTIVVSGEVCPQELVQRWATSNRRMLNVYGPTETTVNTTAAICAPDQPVTIGRPLSGYEIYILDSDLRPVPNGDKGELYIGGGTLARGYLRQPELTAERFILLEGARYYRTGDLVRLNASGELEFFGRIDSQVKIRGYRVELAEIECVLLEHPQIQAASLKLFERDGLQELAAHVVLHDPIQPLNRVEVLTLLESRLPPYMIPGYLDVISEFPRLTSGKVNRALLPEPKEPLTRASSKLAFPATELEEKIANVWAKIFKLAQVSVEDDFFLDLGGHSLVAAQTVTLLRKETEYPVAVRDIYGHATVRKLATHLESQKVQIASEALGRSSREVFESLPAWIRASTSMLQLISIYLIYGIASLPLLVLFLASKSWIFGTLSLLKLVETWVAVTFLSWPAFLALSIVAKWIIVGRYRAGSYPLWGFYHFRVWLAGRFQALSGAGLLAGTPLLPFYLRAMGARIGRHCILDSALCSSFDLMSIGEETSIGADSQYLGYRIEDGMLHLGQIEIGKRCFVGIHSALALNVRMGDDSRLDDQSLLADGEVIPPGEGRLGSPARPAEVRVPQLSPPTWRRFLLGAAQLFMIELMPLLALAPLIPFLFLWVWAFFNHGIVGGLTSLIVSVPLGFISTCLFIAVTKKLALSRATPGTYSIESLFYLRKWLSDGIMRASRAFLLPLYTTIYLPPWLRLIGAKIGARAELSTVWNFAPELIDVGEESFFADGSIIGGRRTFRGSFRIATNRIGKRSFVGNSAILPVGSSLGDRSLLGVGSIPPAHLKATPDGTDWLGSPAFSLPHRLKVGNFDDSVTFSPTRKLYFQRALIDGLRILIPGYIGLLAAVCAVLALYYVLTRYGIAAMFEISPVVGIALAVGVSLMVIALKWIVMGRFKPVIVPLWSMYVWLNEMLNGAYETVMAPALSPFLGTPFLAPFLRMLGCKIGKNTYIESILFSEFDLVEIGDYAALNAGAIIQSHLFEDRVMKSSSLKVGNECTVGNMAIVLYDSEMKDKSILGPLSLLVKGETLAENSRWYGVPTIRVPKLQKLAFMDSPSPNFYGMRTELQETLLPAKEDTV